MLAVYQSAFFLRDCRVRPPTSCSKRLAIVLLNSVDGIFGVNHSHFFRTLLFLLLDTVNRNHLRHYEKTIFFSYVPKPVPLLLVIYPCNSQHHRCMQWQHRGPILQLFTESVEDPQSVGIQGRIRRMHRQLNMHVNDKLLVGDNKNCSFCNEAQHYCIDIIS